MTREEREALKKERDTAGNYESGHFARDRHRDSAGPRADGDDKVLLISAGWEQERILRANEALEVAIGEVLGGAQDEAGGERGMRLLKPGALRRHFDFGIAPLRHNDRSGWRKIRLRALPSATASPGAIS